MRSARMAFCSRSMSGPLAPGRSIMTDTRVVRELIADEFCMVRSGRIGGSCCRQKHWDGKKVSMELIAMIGY